MWEGPLRIGVVPHPPYVFPCAFVAVETCKQKPGINYELVVNVLLRQILQIKDIVVVKSNYFKKKGNTSNAVEWQGLLAFLGMLARNEIDMTGNFLYFDTGEELRSADFGLPIAMIQKGMVMNPIGSVAQDVGFFAFFKPFQETVWLWIVTTFAVGLAMHWIMQFGNRYNDYLTNVTIATTIIVISMAIETFILVRMFKARYYREKIIESIPALPFPSMEAFVESVENGRAKLTVSTYETGILHQVNNSKTPLMQRLHKSLENNPIEIEPSREVHVQKIFQQNERYMMLTSETYYRYLLTNYCGLKFVPWTEASKGMLGLVFRKHSKLERMFTPALYNSAFSINDMYQQKLTEYFPPKMCNMFSEQKAMSRKNKPFKLQEFYAPFTIWAAGTMIGLLLFLAENGWDYIWIRRNLNHKICQPFLVF